MLCISLEADLNVFGLSDKSVAGNPNKSTKGKKECFNIESCSKLQMNGLC